MGKLAWRAGFIAGLLALASAAVVLRIPRPSPKIVPQFHEYSQTMPSAAGYWVEYTEKTGGWIRHESGGAWSIDDASCPQERAYFGECSRLWVVRPPGLGRRFLVFDAPAGAYTMRRVLFQEHRPGVLSPGGDFLTVGEIQGKSEQHVLDATFEDLDGDSVEDLIEIHREWVSDKDGRLVSNWALRTVVHTWNGRRFQPSHTQFALGNEPSPVMKLEVSAFPSPSELTDEKAVAVIWKLPEVVRWRRLLERTKGSVRPLVYSELEPEDGIQGWLIYVGEEHDTHSALFNRYLVHERSREVLVWNGATDVFTPLK